MTLAWTRTVICSIGFIWAMLAWQSTENERRAASARVRDSIKVICADAVRQNKTHGGFEVDPEVCEAGYVLQTAGNGVDVNGTVEVSGTVAVEP